MKKESSEVHKLAGRHGLNFTEDKKYELQYLKSFISSNSHLYNAQRVGIVGDNTM